VGAAAAAQAHGAGGPSRHEVRQGLLRIRRERQEEVLDEARENEASRKAAIWAGVAGLAQLAATAVGAGLYPSWYFLLTAVGYGLILPLVAVLHVRHGAVRQSGAVLGTIAGTAVVTLGAAASANALLVVAAILVRGVWWWTIGKLWWETGILPRWLGVATMALAVACFALAAASGALDLDMDLVIVPLRLALGAWLVLVAIVLGMGRADRHRTS
jgi:hypothetical protein